MKDNHSILEITSDNEAHGSVKSFKVMGKKKTWDIVQTNVLLGYLADNFESYTKGVKATFHQKAAAFLGQERTAAQVKNKLDCLLKQYEEIKNNQNKSGEGRKDWVHYQQLDELFGCRDNVNPELLICGSGEEKQRVDEPVDIVKRQIKKQKIANENCMDDVLKESIIALGNVTFVIDCYFNKSIITICKL